MQAWWTTYQWITRFKKQPVRVKESPVLYKDQLVTGLQKPLFLFRRGVYTRNEIKKSQIRNSLLQNVGLHVCKCLQCHVVFFPFHHLFLRGQENQIFCVCQLFCYADSLRFCAICNKKLEKASAHFITKHPHFATQGLLVC